MKSLKIYYDLTILYNLLIGQFKILHYNWQCEVKMKPFIENDA